MKPKVASSTTAACPTGSTQLPSGTYGGGDDTGLDVCIPAGASVVLAGDESWNTVTVIGGLRIGYLNPCAPPPFGVTLANGGAIDSGGQVSLWSSSSCIEGGDTSLTISSGTLYNSGVLEVTNLGTCGSPPSPCSSGGGRYLSGNVLNRATGTVEATGETLTFQSGRLFNYGAFDVTGSSAFVIPANASATFDNESSGSVSNSGAFTVGSGNTFSEAGTTTGNNILLVGDTVKYTGGGASTLEVQAATTLSGNIATGQTLVLDGASGFCQIASAAVTAAVGFTNAGTISGACGGGPVSLTVSSGTLTNSGTISTKPASLNLSGNVVNSGAVDVGYNQTLTDQSGTFTNNGTVAVTDPSGTFSVPGGAGAKFVNAATGSVSNGGAFTMGSGNTFSEAGTTTGNNILMVGDTVKYTGGGASTLEVQAATTLSGNIATGQTLVLDGASGFCQIASAAVTAAVGFTNAGTIVNRCGGGPASLTVSSGTLLNKGLIHGGVNMSLDVQATVDNEGTIEADYGSNLTVSALTNYSSGTLTGGTYVANGGNGEQLVVPGMDVTTNAAKVYLGSSGLITDGSSDSFRALADNQGVYSLTASTAESTSGSLVNSGTIRLDSISALTVNGSYDQTSTGVYQDTIAGTSPGSTYGQLRASGAASFDGTLAVTKASGYTPSVGDTQQVVTYSSSSGQFGAVTGTSTGNGFHFVLRYTSGAAELVVTATKLSVSPTSGAPSSAVTLKGSGYSPGETVDLSFRDASGTVTDVAPASADSRGAFTIAETVPPGAAIGTGKWSATGQTSFVTLHRPFNVT